MVGRVEAVVDHRRAGGQRAQPVGVGSIGGHALDKRVVGAESAAADEADRYVAAGEQACDGGADGAGPDDQMASGHDGSPEIVVPI
ncbi:MAG: hypothetical protein DLM61_20325 [Pseudonocardiales bacterium]|nr:MAG: hypothetical protein DLM61_20325 [Pseudonocardiales bacterium]